jgi:hypothetical protein
MMRVSRPLSSVGASSQWYQSKFPTQDLSQVLEPLLNGINQSFQQKKTSQAELEEQTQCCDQLLADVSAFNVKFEAFQ